MVKTPEGVHHYPARPLPYVAKVYRGKDAKGNSVYVARSFRTIREAKAGRDALVAEVAKGLHRDDGRDKTVGDALERYVQSPKVLDKDADLGRLKNHVHSLWSLPLKKLTTTRVEDWAAELVERGWRGEPMAPSTVDRTYHSLRAACTMAVRNKWIAENPCSGAVVEMPYLEPVAATLDEVMLLIEEADEPLKLFLQLAASTGQRKGELLALRRSCFVGKDMVVRGTVAKRKGLGAIVKQPKTKRVSRVSVPTAARERLVEHFAQQEAIAAAGEHTFDPDPFVFSPSPMCDVPYYPDSFNGPFRRLRERCGLGAHVTMKSFRSFYATMALEAGIDSMAVSRQLTHTSIVTTERRYVASIPSATGRAADAIGELLTVRD